MDCENIKKLIPSYIKHAAAEEDIKKVEEHLCVCNACREYLAKFMDKEEKFKEKIQHPETVVDSTSNDIKIISEQDIPSELESEEEENSTVVNDKDSDPIQQPEQKGEELETVSTKQESESESELEPKPEQNKTEQKKENKTYFFEYFILLIGIAVLVFFIRLLMKG